MSPLLVDYQIEPPFVASYQEAIKSPVMAASRALSNASKAYGTNDEYSAVTSMDEALVFCAAILKFFFPVRAKHRKRGERLIRPVNFPGEIFMILGEKISFSLLLNELQYLQGQVKSP